MARERRPVEGIGADVAAGRGRASQPAMKPGVEGVAGARRVGRPRRASWRRRSAAAARPRLAAVDAGEDPGAARAALDHDDRRELAARPSVACRPSSASASDSRGEQEVRRRLATSSRAARRPSASSGPTDARSTRDAAPAPRARASSIARGAGAPERLAEQRVRRQVEQVDAVEPLGAEVRRRHARSAAPAVGDERALAARRHEDADPARSDRPATRVGADGDAVALELRRRASGPRRSRPTAQTSVDRAPRRASQRARVRRGAALADLDAARARRSRVSIGADACEHDVEHEVAEDEDPRRRRRRTRRRSWQSRPSQRGW